MKYEKKKKEKREGEYLHSKRHVSRGDHAGIEVVHVDVLDVNLGFPWEEKAD